MAYFKFLELAGNQQETTSTNSDNDNNSVDDVDTSTANIITASLRVLRLLTRHCVDFEKEFRDGLTRVPSGVWWDIVPQICARLQNTNVFLNDSNDTMNNEDSKMMMLEQSKKQTMSNDDNSSSRSAIDLSRELLCETLCSLAEQQPQTALFPVLVGSALARSGNSSSCLLYTSPSPRD